jgi:hypothetical protein
LAALSIPRAAATSDLGPFGQGKRVLDIHAEKSHGTLDLGVAKQDLDSSEIASLLVNQSSLGSTQRM